VSEGFRIKGFEDVWHGPDKPNRRTPEALLKSHPQGVHPRLARLTSGAREVVVAVVGATYGRRQLLAHLAYITRRGELGLEDQDGFALKGREALKDLAQDWAAMARADSNRRPESPLSREFVFSMPPGSDPAAVGDAARASANEAFAQRFDFTWLRHSDTSHPHVHLVARALGSRGERLNPNRADMLALREIFAGQLRSRGVDAQATLRRERGVTRKAEPIALRKMRELYERGEGPAPHTLTSAYLEAAETAFGGAAQPRPWEAQIVRRQAQVRAAYRQQADLLQRSGDPQLQRLGAALESFVAQMPAPDTRRLALARELRALNQDLAPKPPPQRERGR